MRNECHIECVFDPLMGVIMISGGDRVLVLVFPFFCSFHFVMIFYAILFAYYFCSCGFDEFSLIWNFSKFGVLIIISAI